MKKLGIILLALIAMYQGQQFVSLDAVTYSGSGTSFSDADSALSHAFENRQSDVQIEGFGQVVKVLPDDNKGSRHQRFILKLGSGQTVLIAHNIDLAPRVSGLAEGDRIQFFGEYEWNERGGVIHWTHHDPRGRHIGGWLKHNGQTYQ